MDASRESAGMHCIGARGGGAEVYEDADVGKPT